MSVAIASTTTPGPAELGRRARVVKRLRRNPLAVASFAVLLIATLVAVLAP